MSALNSTLLLQPMTVTVHYVLQGAVGLLNETRFVIPCSVAPLHSDTETISALGAMVKSRLHGHILHATTTTALGYPGSGDWQCDSCRKDQPPQCLAYHCADCPPRPGFDMCAECIRTSATLVPRAPATEAAAGVTVQLQISNPEVAHDVHSPSHGRVRRCDDPGAPHEALWEFSTPVGGLTEDVQVVVNTLGESNVPVLCMERFQALPFTQPPPPPTDTAVRRRAGSGAGGAAWRNAQSGATNEGAVPDEPGACTPRPAGTDGSTWAAPTSALSLRWQVPQLPPVVGTSGTRVWIAVDSSRALASGNRLATVRAVLNMVLAALPVDCKFQLVKYGSMFQCLFRGGPVQYDDTAFADAKSWVRGLAPDMGTASLLRLMRGIAAEQRPTDNNIVVLLTTGHADDADMVLTKARDMSHSNGTRVFAFGVGHTADRSLVAGLAQATQGVADFLGNDAAPLATATILRHFSKLHQRPLTQVAVEWGPYTNSVAFQSLLANNRDAVYGGESVVFAAVVDGDVASAPAKLPVTIRGNHAGKPVQFDIVAPILGRAKVGVPSQRSVRARVRRVSAAAVCSAGDGRGGADVLVDAAAVGSFAVGGTTGDGDGDGDGGGACGAGSSAAPVDVNLNELIRAGRVKVNDVAASMAAAAAAATAPPAVTDEGADSATAVPETEPTRSFGVPHSSTIHMHVALAAMKAKEAEAGRALLNAAEALMATATGIGQRFCVPGSSSKLVTTEYRKDAGGTCHGPMAPLPVSVMARQGGAGAVRLMESAQAALASVGWAPAGRAPTHPHAARGAGAGAGTGSGTAAVAGTDSLLAFVNLCRAGGNCEPSATVASLVGRSELDMARMRPATLTEAQWVTALMIAFFQSRLPRRNLEWQPVATKATQWLATRLASADAVDSALAAAISFISP